MKKNFLTGWKSFWQFFWGAKIGRSKDGYSEGLIGLGIKRNWKQSYKN